MDDLPRRVNTGIGPACTNDRNSTPNNLTEAHLKDRLNRPYLAVSMRL